MRDRAVNQPHVPDFFKRSGEPVPSGSDEPGAGLIEQFMKSTVQAFSRLAGGRVRASSAKATTWEFCLSFFVDTRDNREHTKCRADYREW
jgi:hypothetical protein